MIIKATRALVAMALGVCALLAVATPAEARVGCVTRAEYHNIGGRPYGMARRTVTQIFDTRGRVIERIRYAGGLQDIWVRYQACNGSSVVVEYDNYYHYGRRMRLYHKDWQW